MVGLLSTFGYISMPEKIAASSSLCVEITHLAYSLVCASGGGQRASGGVDSTWFYL